MTTDFIPFSRPVMGVEEEEAALRVLRSGWLTTGPEAAAFEQEFASILGVPHALAVNSATSGLHLAVEALGTGAGDIVITTPYTFTATAEVVRYQGAEPLFVDIGQDDFMLDPEQLARTLESMDAATRKRVKAIIPVHFAGELCAMEDICATAERYGIGVVEDCAHSFPASRNGRNAGTFGTFGVFSFYANKTMTTGEGGMIVCHDAELARRARLMRLHGIDREVWQRYTAKASWRYEVVEPGFKYNLPDLAAAIGRVQLAKAETMRQKRRAIAERYLDALGDVPELILPCKTGGHAWHLFVLRLVPGTLSITRDEFIVALQNAGIGTSVHFIPLHLMPYYAQRYSLKPADFPNALARFEQSLSIPLFPDMTEQQISRIIETIRDIVRRHRK